MCKVWIDTEAAALYAVAFTSRRATHVERCLAAVAAWVKCFSVSRRSSGHVRSQQLFNARPGSLN